MSTSKIIYKDIAVGADEDATVASSSATAFSDISQLPFEPEEVKPIPTLELNQWLVDGTKLVFDNDTVSFWSTELCDEDGYFEAPPSITITTTQQYSSLGLALVFDQTDYSYATRVNIEWYQNTTLKDDVDFNVNSSYYFCENRVENWNKIVITFNKMNLPYRYLKLQQIIFGIYRTFTMTDLRRANVVNEINGASVELPISTFNWTLASHEDVDYMFQLKQPVELYNNDNLIGVYYIDNHTRQSKNVYDISCYNAFGVLGETPFAGGAYTNKSMQELFNEIVDGDFEVTYDIPDVTRTGIIAPCTRREALQQVLFAWGALAATDGIKGIRVFTADTTAEDISDSRIYRGLSVDVSSVVTSVQVVAHTYTQSSSGSIEINGQKYVDTQTIYTVNNPNVTANDKQNVIKVDNATLISTNIGQSTAQRVYDYYTKRNTMNAKIVWDGELLGDLVTLPTTWGTTVTGNIETMQLTISNLIATECKVV